AEPDAGCLMARISDEPGIAIVPAGAGLARGEAARGSGRTAGAFRDHRMPHVGHVLRLLPRDRLPGLRFVGIDDVAMLRLDRCDAVRRGAAPFIAESRIGRGQFEQRYLRAAEHDREVARERTLYAELVRRRDDAVHADLVADLH